MIEQGRFYSSQFSTQGLFFSLVPHHSGVLGVSLRHTLPDPLSGPPESHGSSEGQSGSVGIVMGCIEILLNFKDGFMYLLPYPDKLE